MRPTEVTHVSLPDGGAAGRVNPSSVPAEPVLSPFPRTISGHVW